MSRPIVQDNLFSVIQRLQERIERLESKVAQFATPRWETLPLSSPWVDYGSTWSSPGMCLDADGFVHIRGLVRNTVGFAYGTSTNTTVAVLPVGYRPASPRLFPAMMVDSGNARIFVRVDIQVDGVVTIRFGDHYNSLGANTGFASYLSLFSAPVFEAAN
jgi:hypothetical protein